MADEEKPEDAPAEEGEAEGEVAEGEDAAPAEDQEAAPEGEAAAEGGEGEVAGEGEAAGEGEGEGEGKAIDVEEGGTAEPPPEGAEAEEPGGIISDESDVFNELMNAGGKARDAAAMIETLKTTVKEFQEKEMLSAEDAILLQARQEELMKRLGEFGALTVRIQTLLKLSHLTESQLMLLEGPAPGEEKVTFDLEIEDETLPKVIICGSEDHIPRIVVCEPTVKKEEPLVKCCCTKHPIILGSDGASSPGYTGDATMDLLLKQLSSLQQEVKLMNEENNFLTKKLTEITDKRRCSTCNKPKLLCRCDKPSNPPPCCAPKQVTQSSCPPPKPMCMCPIPQKPPCTCCPLPKPPCSCLPTTCQGCCHTGPGKTQKDPEKIICSPPEQFCSCCGKADKKDSSAAITQMETRLRNMVTDVSKMQCQLRELQLLRQQLEEEKKDLCPCFDELF